MDIMSGKGVSKGIAIGAIKFYQRIELDAKKRSITDPEAEIERFHSASSTASVQLSELCIKLAEKLGTQNSLLFEIHKMMLEDLDYQESVCTIIRSESVCAMPLAKRQKTLRKCSPRWMTNTCRRVPPMCRMLPSACSKF